MIGCECIFGTILGCFQFAQFEQFGTDCRVFHGLPPAGGEKVRVRVKGLRRYSVFRAFRAIRDGLSCFHELPPAGGVKVRVKVKGAEAPDRDGHREAREAQTRRHGTAASGKSRRTANGLRIASMAIGRPVDGRPSLGEREVENRSYLSLERRRVSWRLAVCQALESPPGDRCSNPVSRSASAGGSVG